MAAASLVMTDDSTVSRLDRGLLEVEKLFALISGLAVFALMILAVISVGGRNALNQPIPGYVDWIEQAMPLIAFMGISYTQREGGHIRMDLLVGNLKGRALWLAELATTLLILILMMLLVWGTFAHFLRSFDMSQPLWSRDSSMDIGLPIWPAKLIVPVAFGVICLRLMLQVFVYARAVVQGTERPVGVPLIADAATQAALEAATVTGDDNDDKGH
ncbi:TRAP transporter small permease subunit [Alterinioella nitratireducens]|uniref:TRAP transporter small permease subunit n=1 Tax=Alterinioella nitratireducens TaxID=2735915 RepID=UPI001558148D|nr:TRAP transporter small permease [Alterinioella nitratireducens]NPD19837.1 TRAP transporter small permease [Alterinioella nitratireducens]